MTLIKHISIILALCFAYPLSAQVTNINLSGANHDNTSPIEITADTLTLDQESNMAIFEGQARVKQGSLRLGSDKLIIQYDPSNNNIEYIKAENNVIVTNGIDTAQADNAKYSIANQILHLSGKVMMLQNQNTILSNEMTINLGTNSAKLSGNVKTIINPVSK